MIAKFNFKTTKTLGGFVLGFLAVVGSARATPTLILSDSATGASVIIIDEGAGDADIGEAGVVGFNGTVGVWTVNTSTGLVYGTNQSPSLDLSSINKSTAASTLTIQFSADGFGPSAGYVDVAIGGTLAKKGTAGDSALSFTTYWKPIDALFTGAVLTNFTFANATNSLLGFSGNQSMSFDGAASYSLTEVVRITHGSGIRNSSFDAAIEVTDVPSVPDQSMTGLLLGLGLAGLAAGRGRRRS